MVFNPLYVRRFNIPLLHFYGIEYNNDMTWLEPQILNCKDVDL